MFVIVQMDGKAFTVRVECVKKNVLTAESVIKRILVLVEEVTMDQDASIVSV